jgi:biopolymer transport protein ExbD
MNWKVRHEGSPRSVDDLSLQDVLSGLENGAWEPTDEVMGPGESAWVAIENHPQLAEVAADLEPPLPPQHDDETHLDMNALIDVTMVLLIFFILTTSYAALQKRLEAPSASKDSPGVAVITDKQVAEQMILVEAKMGASDPIILVEGKEVHPDLLLKELRGFVRRTSKTTLLLKHDGDVPQDTVVTIIDQAKGAGLDRVRLVVP